MQKATQFQPKVINLSDKHFTKEQISILSLGPKYAIEKEPKKYINELIVDTEVAIRQLDPKLQSTFRYLATKQIRHILKSNRHNVFHKRLQYSVKKIKEIMENNDLALVNADKSKTMVIIDKGPSTAHI